jgi:hypothetical protein
MREIYLGDEGIVDVARFFLGPCQAVNRIARHGYTVQSSAPSG